MWWFNDNLVQVSVSWTNSKKYKTVLAAVTEKAYWRFVRIRTLCKSRLLRRPSRRLFLGIAHVQPWGDTPALLRLAAVDPCSQYTYVHDTDMLERQQHTTTQFTSSCKRSRSIRGRWCRIIISRTIADIYELSTSKGYIRFKMAAL